MVIDYERINKGLNRIEEDLKKNYEVLRKEMKTEAAARLKKTVGQLMEELREFYHAVGMDSLISYFYEETVSFLQYFPKEETLVFVDEYLRVKERAEAFLAEFGEESYSG